MKKFNPTPTMSALIEGLTLIDAPFDVVRLKGEPAPVLFFPSIESATHHFVEVSNGKLLMTFEDFDGEFCIHRAVTPCEAVEELSDFMAQYFED